MVEAKGTPAVSDKDSIPNQVNFAAGLREWCARQRKFLVAERDAAKTPDAKLIRVGMLRMLNNVESVLIQAGTSYTNQPLPSAFPRTFDELSAILLDYYDLPRTFPVMDLLNGRWRFQAIKDRPYHKGPILTLNRYAREKDLVNAILQIIQDTFPAGASQPVVEPRPEDILPGPAPEASAATPLLQEESTQESDEHSTGRGRRAGERFERHFICPCGRVFKYEKAYKTHQESCTKGKNSRDSQRGREEGETFPAQFRCPCGKTFKYEKAYLNHKSGCSG